MSPLLNYETIVINTTAKETSFPIVVLNFSFIYCLISMATRVQWHICGGHKATFKSQFSSSILWVPGIEHRVSALEMSTLIWRESDWQFESHIHLKKEPEHLGDMMLSERSQYLKREVKKIMSSRSDWATSKNKTDNNESQWVCQQHEWFEWFHIQIIVREVNSWKQKQNLWVLLLEKMDEKLGKHIILPLKQIICLMYFITLKVCQ